MQNSAFEPWLHRSALEQCVCRERFPIHFLATGLARWTSEIVTFSPVECTPVHESKACETIEREDILNEPGACNLNSWGPLCRTGHTPRCRRHLPVVLGDHFVLAARAVRSWPTNRKCTSRTVLFSCGSCSPACFWRPCVWVLDTSEEIVSNLFALERGVIHPKLVPRS